MKHIGPIVLSNIGDIDDRITMYTKFHDCIKTPQRKTYSRNLISAIL